MSGADEIREYVNRHYVEPARKHGQDSIEIRAGDVHDALGLNARLPAVCSALGTDKFANRYRVRRTDVRGPLNGANCVLVFEVLA